MMIVGGDKCYFATLKFLETYHGDSRTDQYMIEFLFYITYISVNNLTPIDICFRFQG